MDNVRIFSHLHDGREVLAVRLTNSSGEYADILNYGAAIAALYVKDKKGNLADVVLGVNEGESPENRYLGAVMGRCGNRIAWGRFSIGDKRYQLVIGNPARTPHHLHGAAGNYKSKLFKAIPSRDGHSVVLTHYDDGEDGWECGVDVEITYTLTDEHELHIDYKLTAHGDTVLSPTNHAYFNLNMPQDITSTRLKLYTDTYVPLGELGMPDGRLANVADTPLDFTVERTIGEGLASPRKGNFINWRNYDDPYFFPGESYRKVAEAWNPESGRVMEVYTDQSSVIFFTPGSKGATENKGHIMSGYFTFCLETQYVPNAVNCPEYPSPVFHAGETMRSRTTYKFGVR